MVGKDRQGHNRQQFGRSPGSVLISRLMRSDRYCSRMTSNTEVIDGMKTKEFRSELAHAGFPG